MEKKPLNPKEIVFVSEYLIDHNAKRAAIAAGYSEKTGDKVACLWVGQDREKCPALKRHVWDAVKAGIAEKVERNKIDADYVLNDLRDKNEADLADLFTEQGSLKAVHEMPEPWRKGLISGLEIKQEFIYEDGARVPDGVLVKVKLADRMKVLQMLGDHVDVQAFKKQVGLDTSTYVEAMRKARERRKKGGSDK